MRGIDDNETLTRDFVNDLPSVILAEKGERVGFLGNASKD